MATHLQELISKILESVSKIIPLALEIFNPKKLLKDGITGIFLSVKVLIMSIMNMVSNPFGKRDFSESENIFGLKRKTNKNGKIVSNNGNKCMPPTFFRLLMLVICPPLALLMHLGLKGWLHVLISTFLTVFCFYFPGLLYVVMHVLC